MKIGIITSIDYFNYGNRLQNYAVKTLLEENGCVADTLDICCKSDFIQDASTDLKKVIKTVIPMKVARKLMRETYVKDKRERMIRFKNFTEYFIPLTVFYAKNYEKLKRVKQLKEYDFFIAGSDQIWNPQFAGHQKYFLTFASPEKRIALIASIGVKQIPEHLKSYYRKNLLQMKYISVREESSVDLIRELTEREVDCMLDPTLLVERKQWESIMQKPDIYLSHDYIVSFFLGEEPEQEIDTYAKSHGMQVVHLNNRNYADNYVIGPSEFLYVLSHAKLVLTDSFHAVAFSIKFHRQFYVFHRKQKGMQNMFSRMETLLRKFDLFHRVSESLKDIQDEKIDERKFDEMDEIMRRERESFDEVVKNVIK